MQKIILAVTLSMLVVAAGALEAAPADAGAEKITVWLQAYGPKANKICGPKLILKPGEWGTIVVEGPTKGASFKGKVMVTELDKARLSISVQLQLKYGPPDAAELSTNVVAQDGEPVLLGSIASLGKSAFFIVSALR